jgi:DNA-binding helix-hairpin-helix protein with protein kinase domain
MSYKGKGGIQYNLAFKPFATGGEGEVYDVVGQSGLVAKIYKPGKASLEKERKLVKMVSEPPAKSVLSQIAWPHDVLYDAGSFVGFVMPKMKTHEALNVIYEFGSSAKYPDITWENRLIIAENLCAVLNCVHAVGHVCGDFNPKNISVNPNTGEIVFLDTDSYHIRDDIVTYRCDVGIPEYLPVEVQKKMRGGATLSTARLPTFSQTTDNFALAIHIFQLLMNGVHPFACAIIPSQASIVAPQPSDNILKGDFPFMIKKSGVKIPVFAPEISILPKEIQNLFKRAFVDGHSNPHIRPSPVEWHTALRNLRNELKQCTNISSHQYYNSLPKCPWCEVNNAFAQTTAPKPTLTQTTIKSPITTTPPPPPQQRAVTRRISYVPIPKNKGTTKSKRGLRIFAVLIQLATILAWILAVRSYANPDFIHYIIFLGVPLVSFGLVCFLDRKHFKTRTFGLIATFLFSSFVLVLLITGRVDPPLIARLLYYAYGLGNILASLIALAAPKSP